MPSNIQDALKHLTSTFTVKDIMTHKSRLVCATNAENAPSVSAAYPDFSIIPIKEAGGELTAYYERDPRRAQPIRVDDLVSDGTTLLDLVEILQNRGFSFVLSQQNIHGYVHYSDLNHQMVKWTFYVLLEAVERLVLENLRPDDERAYLEKRLGQRYKQI